MEWLVKATVCLVDGMVADSRQVALERVIGLVGGGRGRAVVVAIGQLAG
jgi:hypothetical protein